MKTAKIWSILVLALGLMLWPAETTKGDAEWSSTPGRVWNTTLTDFIGIGTTTPSAKLHVYGGNLMAEKEGGTVSFYGRVFSNGYHSPATYFYRARGSKAAPAGILNGDPIGFFGFVGRHPTGWSTSAAFFQARADATWTSRSYPTHMLFATCPVNSTAATPRMLIDSTGYVGIGTGVTSPTARLHIREPSGVALRYDRGTTRQADIFPHGSYGGAINLFSDDGYQTIRLEPDIAGQGGFFEVRRSNTSAGFTVDGNTGSNNTRVSITGGSSSSYFDTGATGNSSVSLPSNAISDYEIQDEPGAASSTYSGGAIYLSKTGATIMRSRSITCPTSGYVLVIGSAVIGPRHIYGTDTWGRMGVSDIASLAGWPTNQQMDVRIPSASASNAWHNHPVTAHGLFSVGAGTRTFYLLGHQPYGAATSYVQAYDFQLTCIFIPTAYGAIMATDLAQAGPADPLESAVPGPTAADIAAEQVGAEAFNAARLQAELEEMRAEIEELKQAINETNTPSESEE